MPHQGDKPAAKPAYLNHALPSVYVTVSKMHEGPTSYAFLHDSSFRTRVSAVRLATAIGEQLGDSYLPDLPLPVSLVPPSSSTVGDSLLRWLPWSKNERRRFRYCACLAVGSTVCAGYAYPLSRFPGEKIPKTLRYYTTASTPTNTPPHHTLQNAPSRGCTYMLKLSSEPSLRMVPGHPAFASDPCRITATSAAHMSGQVNRLPAIPPGRIGYRLSRPSGTHLFPRSPFRSRPTLANVPAWD